MSVVYIIILGESPIEAQVPVNNSIEHLFLWSNPFLLYFGFSFHQAVYFYNISLHSLAVYKRSGLLSFLVNGYKPYSCK